MQQAVQDSDRAILWICWHPMAKAMAVETGLTKKFIVWFCCYG